MVLAPLGLLGGTFDPVHFAHLRLAEEALEHLPLARVRWIPSGLPGHRGMPQASAAERIAMLRLAIAGHPRFSLDEADAWARQPVYTVHTLERLRAELGGELPLVLIIGADQFQALNTWHDWKRLFQLAHIAVAERPGYPAAGKALPREVAAEYAHRQASAASVAERSAGCIARFPMTALDISASTCRDAIAAGRSARYLLPDTVLDYIASHGLYLRETNTR
ncbi:MAG: nicotinate-nucleotide adenylyltransferase [Betaproteobacteria bacterium]|nr:nicotinate-nucleotide adenylyltransferase [Betaproteobacteria bacterium]